ncbi:MAG: adenosylmethionine--8-amino-7-oxononanoate transaminase [Gammaproteobacteria bacterium]|nr:adenosylmethionine--8-amino-7-oxononanoate transaminase [Gammaproteobacteria bacterium]|tara:strand:- start:1773 stop:3041 length:1269 start_codon:yes stop_codon:yes gene_type:complete
MNDLLDFDRQHIWHPYTSVRSPIPAYHAVSASGVRIELADGTELIDGMASWWCAIHGYSHPVLTAALSAQADKMAHVMFGGLTHEPAVELARRLVDITPQGLDYVFFSDSGSVSVEVAIKMAIQYWQAQGRPKKHRLLTIRGGYHGDTFGAMAVCDPVGGMHALFQGVLPQHLFAPQPSSRFGEPLAAADARAVEALMEAHAGEMAAVILEPVVQGAGGMWFYSAEYLRHVEQLCRRHDVLLIADEIATGFGRSGTLFACEHAQVVPDIMCLGKALTGGYLSQAATLANGRVADGISQDGGVLMHGPTFMGNPTAAAVAIASIDLLLAGGWQARVHAIEEQLARELAPYADDRRVADVRVLGAIGVVETVQEVDVASAQRAFVAEGVWIRPFRNLIYVMPPYVIEPEDLSRLTAAIALGLPG